MVLNKDGETLYHIDSEKIRPDSKDPRVRKFIKYNKNIRDNKKIQSDDESVVITMNKIPEDVCSILFLLKMPKL